MGVPMAETALFSPLCSDLLRSGQAVRFRAPGGSMHPTIRDGENITVRPLDPALVRRGDVVLYGGRRGLTAHRVVRLVGERRQPDYFVLRGDNGAGYDEVVDPSRLLGRVSSVERRWMPRDPSSTAARLGARAWRSLARIRRLVSSLTAAMRLELPRTRRRHRNAG